MERLTAKRVNGIKEGYWTAAKKEDVVQRLGELEDQLEKEKTSGQAEGSAWISVKERLPKLGAYVLVARLYEINRPMKIEQARLTAGGRWMAHGTICKNVAYWMQTPELPEVKR